MFFCRFRKLIAGILIGFGVGILLVLFLPPVAWICIIGLGMLIGGIKFLLGKQEEIMKIVVKKVPKFLRGFVKFIFGIKSTQIKKQKNH